MSVTFPQALDPVEEVVPLRELHPGISDSANPAAAATAPVFINSRLETVLKGMFGLDAN